MPSVLQVAEVAFLLGDPARVNMLLALADGRALPAGELALAARVAPATASGHLGRLLDGGLLAVVPQGRHRYYRVASEEVATLVESVLVLAARDGSAFTRNHPHDSRVEASLREARLCYNHLAGRLGVGLAEGLRVAGHVDLGADGGEVTAAGREFLACFGLDLAGGARKAFCRTCVDWSERRPHLSGWIGTALCQRCFELGWIERRPDSRAVKITVAGREGFQRSFGIGFV